LFEFELKTDEIRDKANFVLNNLTQVELDLLMEVAKADNSKELGKRLGVKASTARKRKERLIKDRIKPMLCQIA
jgi:DNA-binding protein Fis